MSADTLFYDSPTQIGVARGRVEFFEPKGKSDFNWGSRSVCRKNWANPRIWACLDEEHHGKGYAILNGGYLGFFKQQKDSIRKLYAYKNVLLYKSDLSGKCDSLAYDVTDSVIHFYQKPILWTNDSQSQADSISLFLTNQKLKEMRLRGKSFVISKDSADHYNQIKGRKVWVFLTKKVS